MFGSGRNLITSINHKSKDYNLVANYDQDYNQVSLLLFEGDWQIPNGGTLLWAYPPVHIPSADEPQVITEKAMANLNDFLKTHFAEDTSMDWGDRLTVCFRKITFFLENDIPQVKSM